MERLLDLLRRHLQETSRGEDSHQAARLGAAAMATETARLWVAHAATITEGLLGSRAPDQLVAYVNLARLAVEAAALDLMQLVQRSVGLQAFLRPNPLERIARDLATYLRQPGPDRALKLQTQSLLASPLLQGFTSVGIFPITSTWPTKRSHKLPLSTKLRLQ
jgi:alkylation response protein AidB-like acyl-CoA dehydrogenase